MLVARRDPPLHPASMRAHGRACPDAPSGSLRFTTAVQVLGSLRGDSGRPRQRLFDLPLQFHGRGALRNLRGNIISMLDKSTDASTLRMLVRRDVVTFETSCGAVDPDAVKAFKALLAAKDAPQAGERRSGGPRRTPKSQTGRKRCRRPVAKPSRVRRRKGCAGARRAEAKPAAKPVRVTPRARCKLDQFGARGSDARAGRARSRPRRRPRRQRNPSRRTCSRRRARGRAARRRRLRRRRASWHQRQSVPPVSLAAPAAPALPEPVPVAAAPAPRRRRSPGAAGRDP